jgi:hypothetical protein
MDKKEAEEEAMRRAKQAHNAAGKNTGMSGRDLVCYYVMHLHRVLSLIASAQFQYNPEWFEEEDDGDGSEDWDLDKYRKQQEDENLSIEQQRIAGLSLRDGVSEGNAEGSGGGDGGREG